MHASWWSSSLVLLLTTILCFIIPGVPFKFDYKVQTTTDNNDLVDLVPKICRLLDMYKHYEHTVDLLDTYRSTSELTSLDKVWCLSCYKTVLACVCTVCMSSAQYMGQSTLGQIPLYLPVCTYRVRSFVIYTHKHILVI